ncbi:EamA family transporter [Pseudomonadota bacterium]
MTETSLSPLLILMVLVAAFMHATWNTLVKSADDQLLVLSVVNFVCSLAGLVIILSVGYPNPECWPYIILSALIHTGYYFFLLKAYEHGDLSLVYPLARGSAPLLVLAGGMLFANEKLPVIGLLGVTLASIGIVSLAFERGWPWHRDSKPIIFALGTSLFIAAYTLADGIGVRVSDHPLTYIAWLFFIDGIPISIYAMYRRGAATTVFLRLQWKRCLLGGASAMLAYGIVIYAMSLGTMALVAALRETSVIMAAIIGSLVLKEALGNRRMVAAILVAVGVCTMNLAT